MTKWKEWVFTPGLTVECIPVNGTKTKCMVRGFTLGQMDALIQVTIKTIRNKVQELIFGLITNSSKEIGKTVSNMEKEFSRIHWELVEKEDGKKRPVAIRGKA